MSSASATGYDPDGGSDRAEGDGRLLRRVVDQLPAMVAYWDADLRNHIASGAYLSWFGLTAEEVRGWHIRDVIGPEAYAVSRKYIEGALAGEEQLFQRTVTDASGRRRHTQVSYVPDVVGGRVVGFFGLISDTTERVEESERLRKVVEEYRVLARSIPRSLTMVFDRDLRFTLADGPGLADFSLTTGEMEGRTLHEALPHLAAALEPRYRSVLDGETVQWDADVGGRVYALVAGPVRDEAGSVTAGLVIGTEVTGERRREATHRHLREIAVAVAGGATLDRVLHLTVSAVLELFDADFAGSSRFDDRGRLEVVVVVPEVPELAARPHLDEGTTRSRRRS